MAKGRKKKLSAIDWLDGHPGHRPLVEHYGIETSGEPFISEHLLDDARGCIECIKASMPPKIYSALDSYLLACFGMAWAAHKAASIAMSAPDFSIVSKRGQISRWYSVMRQAAADIVTIGGRLGLDPASRQALRLPASRQQQSKFANLSGTTHAAPIASSNTSSSFESQAERVKGGHSN